MDVTPVVDAGLGDSAYVVDLGDGGAPQLLAPAGSELAFDHRPLRDGDELHLGGLTLEVIATPGHAPEHLAYPLRDGSRPVAMFSGGPLMAGGVARHVPGAPYVELGTLATTTEGLPATSLLLHGGHGERAMSATSLLERPSHDDVAVLAGGLEELGELETGAQA